MLANIRPKAFALDSHRHTGGVSDNYGKIPIDRSNLTLRHVGRLIAYGLLGLIGTAGVMLLVLNVRQPVQAVLYRAMYLQVGPSEATETAILAQFLAAGLIGISVPKLIGDYLSDGLEHRRALGVGVGVIAGLFVGFLAITFAGLAAFLTAFIILIDRGHQCACSASLSIVRPVGCPPSICRRDSSPHPVVVGRRVRLRLGVGLCRHRAGSSSGDSQRLRRDIRYCTGVCGGSVCRL